MTIEAAARNYIARLEEYEAAKKAHREYLQQNDCMKYPPPSYEFSRYHRCQSKFGACLTCSQSIPLLEARKKAAIRKGRAHASLRMAARSKP